MPDEAGPTTLPADDPGAVSAAVTALRSGGIVGIPTETVYGLAVVPRPAALSALLAAKRRPEEKGVVLLIDDLEQVADLVHVPDAALRLARRLWPGALTLVLPLARPASVPTLLTGGRETLGLRIPDHRVPRVLARQLGPIAVTSANRTGRPEARSARELIAHVGASLSLVLDDGPARGGVPSSVVAVLADGRISVLREGALSEALIGSVLSEVP